MSELQKELARVLGENLPAMPGDDKTYYAGVIDGAGAVCTLLCNPKKGKKNAKKSKEKKVSL